MRRRTFAVLLLSSLGCARHPMRDLSPYGDAVVVDHTLVVTFPVASRPAAAWTAPGHGPASGFPYYNWRFGVAGVNGFTAIASVDKDSPDAANARGSLEAIVKHLSLRRCGPGGHILECPQIIAGTMQAIERRRYRS